jgi:translation initiation factor IF-1
VELSNGHRLLAHRARRRDGLAGLEPGRKVTLELSPCDFSTGRIIEMEKQT